MSGGDELFERKARSLEQARGHADRILHRAVALALVSSPG
jgi:hypothetical protein